MDYTAAAVARGYDRQRPGSAPVIVDPHLTRERERPLFVVRMRLLETAVIVLMHIVAIIFS